MTHSYLNRTLSIVHMCALLAVLATLAIVVSHVSAGAVNPGACQGLSAAAQPQCAVGESNSPVGYRLP